MGNGNEWLGYSERGFVGAWFADLYNLSSAAEKLAGVMPLDGVSKDLSEAIHQANAITTLLEPSFSGFGDPDGLLVSCSEMILHRLRLCLSRQNVDHSQQNGMIGSVRHRAASGNQASWSFRLPASSRFLRHFDTEAPVIPLFLLGPPTTGLSVRIEP